MSFSDTSSSFSGGNPSFLGGNSPFLTKKRIFIGILLLAGLIVVILWKTGVLFSSSKPSAPSSGGSTPATAPSTSLTPSPPPGPSSSPPPPTAQPIHFIGHTPSPGSCDPSKTPLCPQGFSLTCDNGVYKCVSTEGCSITCDTSNALCYGTCQPHTEPLCINGKIECVDSCGVFRSLVNGPAAALGPAAAGPNLVLSPGMHTSPNCVPTPDLPLKCFTCDDQTEAPYCAGGTLKCGSLCLGIEPYCGEGSTTTCNVTTKQWSPCSAPPTTTDPRTSLIQQNKWLNSKDPENNIHVTDVNGNVWDVVFTTTAAGAIGDPIAPLVGPAQGDGGSWFTGTLTPAQLSLIGNPAGQLVQKTDQNGHPIPGVYILYKRSDTHDINGVQLIWYQWLKGSNGLPDMWCVKINPCKNGGTYNVVSEMDESNQFSIKTEGCICPDHTAGTNCQYNNAAPNPLGCSGHGVVKAGVDTNETPYCENCEPPYTGKYCEFNNNDECGANGTLVARNYTWNAAQTAYIPTVKYCDCNSSWLGDQCQYSDGTTCNGQGTVDANGNCICKLHYSGQGCRYHTMPNNTYTLGVNPTSWVTVKVDANTGYPSAPPLSLVNSMDTAKTGYMPPNVVLFTFTDGALSIDAGPWYQGLMFSTNGQLIQGTNSNKWYLRSDSSVIPQGMEACQNNPNTPCPPAYQLCQEDASGNISALRNDLSGWVTLATASASDVQSTYFSHAQPYVFPCTTTNCNTGVYRIQNADGTCMLLNTDPSAFQTSGMFGVSSYMPLTSGSCDSPSALWYYDYPSKTLSSMGNIPQCLISSRDDNTLGTVACGTELQPGQTTLNNSGVNVNNICYGGTCNSRVVPVSINYDCAACNRSCYDSREACSKACQSTGLGTCSPQDPYIMSNVTLTNGSGTASYSGSNVTPHTVDLSQTFIPLSSSNPQGVDACLDSCTNTPDCELASYLPNGSCFLMGFQKDPNEILKIPVEGNQYVTIPGRTYPLGDANWSQLATADQCNPDTTSGSYALYDTNTHQCLSTQFFNYTPSQVNDGSVNAMNNNIQTNATWIKMRPGMTLTPYSA